MNKKAQSSTSWIMSMMWRLIFLSVMALVIVKLFVGMAQNVDLETSHVQNEALLARIIYSPNVITFSEDDRSYTGIVDLEKFTQENIEKSINYTDSPAVAARISLEGNSEREIFVNEGNFKIWKPIADAGLRGPGSTNLLTKSFVVGVLREGEIEKGLLKIEVVSP